MTERGAEGLWAGPAGGAGAGQDPQVCVEHSEADEEGCQMSRRDRRERHHLGSAKGAVLSVGLAGPVCLQRPAKEQEASGRVLGGQQRKVRASASTWAFQEGCICGQWACVDLTKRRERREAQKQVSSSCQNASGTWRPGPSGGSFPDHSVHCGLSDPAFGNLATSLHPG